MAKVKVTLVRSRIGMPKTQERTIDALGLKKMNSTAVHEATPAINGMIRKVKNYIKVEETK